MHAWARPRVWTGPTSMMSALVRLSCGSLYSVYLSSTLSMSVLAYWKSLLEWLKMMSAISQSHSTLSSYAFFINPNFRLVNVTCKDGRVVRPRTVKLCQGLSTYQATGYMVPAHGVLAFSG